jgi:hypothetical protein
MPIRSPLLAQPLQRDYGEAAIQKRCIASLPCAIFAFFIRDSSGPHRLHGAASWRSFDVLARAVSMVVQWCQAKFRSAP